MSSNKARDLPKPQDPGVSRVIKPSEPDIPKLQKGV